MALVYEGRRDSMAGISTKVAIKVILPNYAKSEAFKELFINEARLGAAMQHQNLVQIQDFDAEGDQYFLVMEYVEGLTLSRVVGLAARHDLRIPPGVICELGRQVCDGLQYAHDAVDTDGNPLGLVHRDIKPSNLILNPHGVMKILDFGISKGALRHEADGQVKGTWGYMSPEQSVGQSIGPQADIFALAIVLWEMAARRAMFKGKKEDEIRRLLQEDNPVRVASSLHPQYAPLMNVLVRALQRDASSRFPTAAAFGRALSELLPDPITARDEVLRFQDALEVVRGGAPRASAAMAGGARPAASPPPIHHPASPAIDLPGDRQHSTLMTTLATAGAALFTVLVLVVFVSVLNHTTRDSTVVIPGTPPGAAVQKSAPPSTMTGPAPSAAAVAAPEVKPEASTPVDTPPPASTSRTPRPRPAASTPRSSRASAPSAAPAAEKSAPKAAAPATAEGDNDPDAAYLRVRLLQEADVFVDGKRVDDPETYMRLEPGRHTLTVMRDSGVSTSTSLKLKAGERITRTWDFDQWEWR